MTSTGCPADLSRLDVYDPEFQQCPYPTYRAMREQAPVLEVEINGRPVWLISTAELVNEVVQDAQTFSSRFGTPAVPPAPELIERIKTLRADEGAYPFVPTLLTADPPQHTRYRKLVTIAFTPRSISLLEPSIRRFASQLVQSWPEREPFDYVSSFAVPLPTRVVALALNVPEEDMPDFKRWSDNTTAAQGVDISDEERLAAERGVIEFQRYFKAAIDDRRAHPQDDILTNLVQATIDPSDPDSDSTEPVSLDDSEILSILQQLLVAGNETTTKALSEMTLLLGQHPEVWDAVCNDEKARRNLAEEALRLGSPGLAIWRKATREVELGGVRIPEGGRVMVLYGSANRDPVAYPAGDEFDLGQATMSHLSFGKGEHFCIGSSLARMEMRIALEEMTRQISGFHLAPGYEPRYVPSFMLRGLESLEIEATRR